MRLFVFDDVVCIIILLCLQFGYIVFVCRVISVCRIVRWLYLCVCFVRGRFRLCVAVVVLF